MKTIYDNSLPLYIQICQEMKLDIISGKILPGEKLLSVRNLAQKWEVNPNTVVKTLDILENEGFIYTDSTNGKFVIEDLEFIKKAKQEYLKEEVKSFIERLNKLGYKTNDLLELIRKEGK